MTSKANLCFISAFCFVGGDRPAAAQLLGADAGHAGGVLGGGGGAGFWRGANEQDKRRATSKGEVSMASEAQTAQVALALGCQVQVRFAVSICRPSGSSR